MLEWLKTILGEGWTEDIDEKVRQNKNECSFEHSSLVRVAGLEPTAS